MAGLKRRHKAGTGKGGEFAPAPVAAPAAAAPSTDAPAAERSGHPGEHHPEDARATGEDLRREMRRRRRLSVRWLAAAVPASGVLVGCVVLLSDEFEALTALGAVAFGSALAAVVCYRRSGTHYLAFDGMRAQARAEEAQTARQAAVAQAADDAITPDIIAPGGSG